MKTKQKLILTNLTEVQAVEFLPTGLKTIDTLCNGIPVGRIIEIFGEEGTGKSTLLYTIMINYAKLNKKICFFDLENSFDIKYFNNIGGNSLTEKEKNNIVFADSLTGKDLLEGIYELAQKKSFDIIILDSIAAIVPPDEAIGAHARMFTIALRKIAYACKLNKVTFIASNQVRYAFKGMIAHQITTGGNALKHWASLRLSLVTLENDKKKIISKIQVVKSKVSIPFQYATIQINAGKGINKEYDLVESLVLKELIEKKGNMYIYNKKLYKLKGILKLIKETNLEKDNEIKKTTGELPSE